MRINHIYATIKKFYIMLLEALGSLISNIIF